MALTGFAVAWGLFMLIFLLGAGNGLIHAVQQQSDNTLTNSMEVYGGQTSIAYNGFDKGRMVSLNEKDLFLTDSVFARYVEGVGGKLQQFSIYINNGKDEVLEQDLTGVYPSHAYINKISIVAGRFINDIDMKEKRKVLVLSQSQGKKLAKNYHSLIGRHVKVNGLAFQVVGIYKDNESRQNKDAYTAFSTMKAIYKKGDKVGTLEFALKGLETEKQNDGFEQSYRRCINKNHDASPNDSRAIWLWNRYTSNMQMNTGIGIIRSALWIVGLFSLLSGIVGVSNIMLIAVKERTREFGIRKAIGAKPWSILKHIIVESIVITTFFGYIGMVCGILANECMDTIFSHATMDVGLFKMDMFVNPTVGIDVCVEAMLVMVLAGTIAGLFPAVKAARIRPIEALRAE